MATYKVLQDVEAEDKLIGPLTLRQFIYGIVTAVCLYLSYVFTTHGAGLVMVILLPLALTAGFFAFPWGRDQPTEVWALAKVRFSLKPRRRIWNQDGLKELVTITVPKKVHMDYTNGLSQDEVKNRLHALASTIDSRGWAIKNANLSAVAQTPLVMAAPSSDRLVEAASLPQPADISDIQAKDDILDEQNNAGAQRLQSMIDQSAKTHHDKLLATMQNGGDQTAPAKPENYWFLNQPAAPTNIPNNMVTFNTQVVTPGAGTDQPMAEPVQDEAGLVAQLDAKKQTMPTSNLHTIKPLSAHTTPLPPVQDASQQPNGTAPPEAPAKTPAPVTPAKQAAILHLAHNDDLSVATIAREAERSAAQGEVVIKLH